MHLLRYMRLHCCGLQFRSGTVIKLRLNCNGFLKIFIGASPMRATSPFQMSLIVDTGLIFPVSVCMQMEATIGGA